MSITPNTCTRAQNNSIHMHHVFVNIKTACNSSVTAKAHSQNFLLAIKSHYTVYKDIWNPTVSETLNCKPEARNPQDPYVVGLRKDDTTVGHVPHLISCICTLFLRSGDFIEAAVTGQQR